MDSFLIQKLSSISFIRTESNSDKIHRSSRGLLHMCLKKNELVSNYKERPDRQWLADIAGSMLGVQTR
jgi:hypothetical protein